MSLTSIPMSEMTTVEMSFAFIAPRVGSLISSDSQVHFFFGGGGVTGVRSCPTGSEVDYHSITKPETNKQTKLPHIFLDLVPPDHLTLFSYFCRLRLSLNHRPKF